MIIDKILDRKDGIPYDARTFYNDMMVYHATGGHAIATALDSGEEHDVKRELARYIVEQEYNLDIITYINSVNWL